ncbi:MAG: hypothetical protein QNK37_15275 [Acidobacteriota bacterium]|nr:hypothetical protein [Acidobacteriota bacterium]
MPKNVNFRVVGLYFGWSGTNTSPNTSGPVTVDFDGSTVQDLMAAATIKVAGGGVPGVLGFAYTPTAPSPPSDINKIIVVYDKGGPKKGGHLPGGTWVLEDSLTSQPQRVFQYYIFDENFTQLNRNGEFKPFTDPPAVPIPDNGYVIIRQVCIATAPVGGGRSSALAKRYATEVSNNIK